MVHNSNASSLVISMASSAYALSDTLNIFAQYASKSAYMLLLPADVVLLNVVVEVDGKFAEKFR